jgi:methylated-DNA-[protein]-cysteine S-methyltransferase
LGLTFGELKETQLGPMSFIAGDNGLQRVAFKPLALLKSEADFNREGPSLKGLETVGVLLAEMNEYLFGIRREFTVDIDWGVLNDFQYQILSQIAKIPYGDVWSYGEVAARLGSPKAARAIGGALSRNPMPIVIPCHRVIGSDHKLHGYSAPGGVDTKRQLLEIEGHTIAGECVIMSYNKSI